MSADKILKPWMVPRNLDLPAWLTSSSLPLNRIFADCDGCFVFNGRSRAITWSPEFSKRMQSSPLHEAMRITEVLRAFADYRDFPVEHHHGASTMESERLARVFDSQVFFYDLPIPVVFHVELGSGDNSPDEGAQKSVPVAARIDLRASNPIDDVVNFDVPPGRHEAAYVSAGITALDVTRWLRSILGYIIAVSPDIARDADNSNHARLILSDYILEIVEQNVIGNSLIGGEWLKGHYDDLVEQNSVICAPRMESIWRAYFSVERNFTFTWSPSQLELIFYSGPADERSIEARVHLQSTRRSLVMKTVAINASRHIFSARSLLSAAVSFAAHFAGKSVLRQIRQRNEDRVVVGRIVALVRRSVQ